MHKYMYMYMDTYMYIYILQESASVGRLHTEPCKIPQGLPTRAYTMGEPQSGNENSGDVGPDEAKLP